MRGLNRSGFAKELSTGVLVTVAAVPLVIGLAAVAGVPPVTGLYTCVWPLVVFAILGSSPHVKLGMDASSAALIAATVPALVVGQPDRYVAFAAALTALAGAVVLLAGLLRLGIVADLLSLPVLVGYTAGIAISVVIGQLPRMLGYPASGTNDLTLLWDVVAGLGQTHVATLLTGAVALAAVRVLRARRRSWPAAAIVLVAGIAASWALDLESLGVAVVGTVPSGIPVPALPDVSLSELRELAGPALGIALVIAADAVITSRSFAARLGYRVDANRDLMGLGAANLSSSVTGGVVASASYARTAIAEENGSRSQVSGVLAAVSMLVVLVALPGVLSSTPLALLSAIVIDAVLRLVDVGAMIRLVRVRRAEGGIAFLTVVGVLVLGLLPTIALALTCTIALAAYDLVGAWRRHVEQPARPRFGRFSSSPPTRAGDVAVIAWQGPLIFLNSGRFRQDAVDALADAPEGATVVLDCRDVTMVDATGAALLAELEAALDERHVHVDIEDLPDVMVERVDRSRR